EQHHGSARDTLALHEAERWRDALIEGDDAFSKWVESFPQTDTQQLRALVRQARKDRQITQEEISKGLAPRQSRSYREIFQLVRDRLAENPEREDA
ncbi:MAG: DUF615 domain-containing protein, partial [Haliea sp.]